MFNHGNFKDKLIMQDFISGTDNIIFFYTTKDANVKENTTKKDFICWKTYYNTFLITLIEDELGMNVRTISGSWGVCLMCGQMEHYFYNTLNFFIEI